MTIHSIQLRLTAGLTITILLLLAIHGWAVDQLVWHTTTRYTQARIEHDLEALAGALTFSASGEPRLDAPEVNPIYRQPLSGHYWQVHANGHLKRSRSLWDESLDPTPLSPGERRRWRATGPRGEPLLVVGMGIDKQGHHASLVVAEEAGTVEQAQRQFRQQALMLTLALLLILLAIQRWVIRRGLAPLTTLRQQLHQLERGERERLEPEVASELRPLADEINRLLQVMGRRLQRSRHAAGNLAHAIKTPLTLLQHAIGETAPPQRDELNRHVSTLLQRMERELRRARVAGSGSGRRVPLNQEIDALMETMQLLYRQRNLDIQLTIAPDSHYPIDREDLLEMLGNLLDNSCRAARAVVRMTVDTRSGLSVVIEDDGPGIPPAQRLRLLQRGTRLDEQQSGSGLGLAIAGEIVTDYGGRLTIVEPLDLPGARVVIELPDSTLSDQG